MLKSYPIIICDLFFDNLVSNAINSSLNSVTDPPGGR